VFRRGSARARCVHTAAGPVGCLYSIGHEERVPALPLEQPARCGQESTVSGPKCRARNLPAQRRELMAQDDDLHSLRFDERKHSNTSTITRPTRTHSNDASTDPPLIDGASDTTASSAQNARASGHDRVYAPHTWRAKQPFQHVLDPPLRVLKTGPRAGIFRNGETRTRTGDTTIFRDG
jgi:hypothetical protein